MDRDCDARRTRSIADGVARDPELSAIVHVPFGPALLAGAVLSATDPIAVVAIFRRLRVPKTLVTIVECESLFNDAVAVALYRAVLAAIAIGAANAGGIALVTIATLGGAAGAVVLGVATAFAVARSLRGSRNGSVQIAVTALGAYGVYFAADNLRLSGIFATIAFGIALRYYERSWITLRLVENVNHFWDVAALVANVPGSSSWSARHSTSAGLWKRQPLRSPVWCR